MDLQSTGTLCRSQETINKEPKIWQVWQSMKFTVMFFSKGVMKTNTKLKKKIDQVMGSDAEKGHIAKLNISVSKYK